MEKDRGEFAVINVIGGGANRLGEKPVTKKTKEIKIKEHKNEWSTMALECIDGET